MRRRPGRGGSNAQRTRRPRGRPGAAAGRGAGAFRQDAAQQRQLPRLRVGVLERVPELPLPRPGPGRHRPRRRASYLEALRAVLEDAGFTAEVTVPRRRRLHRLAGGARGPLGLLRPHRRPAGSVVGLDVSGRASTCPRTSATPGSARTSPTPRSASATASRVSSRGSGASALRLDPARRHRGRRTAFPHSFTGRAPARHGAWRTASSAGTWPWTSAPPTRWSTSAARACCSTSPASSRSTPPPARSSPSATRPSG